MIRNFFKKLIYGTSIEPRKILFGLGSGLKIIIDPMNKAQRIFGLDESEIHSEFSRFSKLSNIFVDVGASDGYYGLIYRKVNTSGNIYLFDLDSSFGAVQKENFSLNGYSLENLVVSSKMISSETTNDKLALKDFLQPKADDVIFFKIDVDGGEVEVLRGLVPIIGKVKCCLIVETHSLILEKECIEILNDLGCEVRIINNGWYRTFVPELRPISHNRWISAVKR